MRRALLLLVLCCCGAVALAAGGIWFVDLHHADAGSIIFTVDIIDDDGDADPGDGECDVGGGGCSLRAAIMESNAFGADTIQFNIPGTGVHIIGGMASALPTITDTVTIDATTEGDYAGVPRIRLNGDGLASGNGFSIGGTASGSAIRGFAIINFPSHGINVDSSSATIEANYIGVAEDGTSGAGNGGSGVRLNGGSNVVGGTAVADRNVISDNTSNGVLIAFGGNTVQGNYIGTTAAGTADLGNGGAGVRVDGGAATIGGSPAAPGDPPGNVISGNGGAGVSLAAGSGHVAQGNVIGASENEVSAIPNANGVEILSPASSSTIGGSSSSVRNVISGNSGNGVLISGESADGNTVAGNQIGVRLNGTGLLGNGFTGVGIINGADSNTVGGLAGTTGSPPGNVISGNGTNGVGIGAGGTSTGNVVQGNYTGLDAAGTGDFGNTGDGVALFSGASGNTIGGTTTTARNVISGNGGEGVEISGGASGNTVAGNYIGTNAAGTGAIANTFYGVYVSESPSNTIGGLATTPGTPPGNVISGNGSHGVYIPGDASDGNSVLGNVIGLNASGADDLGNVNSGVFIGLGDDNVVGSSLSGARNVISGNDDSGVTMAGAGTTGNTVRNNYIGTDIGGTLARPNSDNGVLVTTGASANTIGGTTTAERNVISGNGLDGIEIAGASSGVVVQGNYIGTNAAGTAALANVVDGVSISGASTNNLIGGTEAGARNIVVAGSAALGSIAISGAGTSGNLVQGNYVGMNAAGTVGLGTQFVGIAVDSASVNTIGGTVPGARNVVGNGSLAGIAVGAASGSAAGTVIQGNYVGTNAAGTGAIANGTGVGAVYGASGVLIGGSAAGEANLIAFNSGSGVVIGSPSFPPTVSAIIVRGNTVHSNGALGIDHSGDGVTANDAGDADTGDNGLQNFPVLTSAQTGSAVMKGTFNSTASSIFVLDFYASPSCDASGNGEGQTYLGASAVVTDGAGNAAFEVAFDAPLSVGQAVTATATDTAGSTSEFSACFTATPLTFTPLIGTGVSGDCGPTPTPVGSCAINLPRGLHEVFGPAGVMAGEGEAASGLVPALYFAEGAPNNKIKKLEPADSTTGIASDVAGGDSMSMYCDNCNRLTTSLDGPRDVFVHGKAVYVADTNNCIVRRVDLTSNLITTVAGQLDACSYSSDGVDAKNTTLNSPRGVAVDAMGNLYIADTLNHRIRKVSPEVGGDGIVNGSAGEIITTIAGTGTMSTSPTDANGDFGPATAATFNQPHDVYLLVEDLIIADTNNNKIRRIDYPAGTITTIAGTGVFDYTGDGGLATSATLNRPEAVTAANNKVVIADTKNHAIRMVDLIGRLGDPATPPRFPSVLPGTITTIAAGSALNNPAGVFIVSGPSSADGALRVSNTDGHMIVSAGIDPTGTHTTNIRPSVSCGNVPGVSGVDWLLPVMMLGAIAGRRRIGTLFSRLYALATRRAPSPFPA